MYTLQFCDYDEEKQNKMPIALACTRDAVMMPDSDIA